MITKVAMTLILPLFLIQSSISTVEMWSNEDQLSEFDNDMKVNQRLHNFDNKCKENGDCAHLTSMKNEVMKRKIHHAPSFINSVDELPSFSYFAPLHHHQPKFCSCSHEKRLVDLGPQYFPRYIADMVCIPGGCGNNYACRPKRFNVWVMRKRLDDEDAGAEPIPKELRDYWVGESIVTTIDCECAL